MKNNHIIRILAGTALVLLVPLVEMLFTDEVNWNLFDFVIVGALLIGAGLLYELITTKVSRKYRGIIAIALVGAVALVWVELAVGIFGTPIAGN